MATWNPSPEAPESKRRSQRVILSVPILVRTEASQQDASYEEETHTLVVNAHGALIGLAARVKKGQKLLLKNRATQMEQDCQVTYLGPASGNKSQIGVEFLKPSPDFWRIAFPPEDWIVPEETPLSTNDK